MNREQLEVILRQIPRVKRYNTSGKSHLSLPCLLGFRHKYGKDSSPSMTISHSKGKSYATCFGCGYKGYLTDTLHQYNSFYKNLGNVLLQAMSFEASPQNIPELEDEQPEVIFYDEALTIHQQIFPKHATSFLKTKGVSARAAEKFCLKYVPKDHSDEWYGDDINGDPKTTKVDGILLPVFSWDSGDLHCVGAQIRFLEGNFRYLALYSFQSTKYFFGEQYVPKYKDKPILLVEGPFDVIHLASMGIPTLGLFGTHLSPAKALRLQAFKPSMVFVVTDPDKAGIDARAPITTELSKHLIPNTILPVSKDPKHYTKDEIRELIHGHIRN